MLPERLPRKDFPATFLKPDSHAAPLLSLEPSPSISFAGLSPTLKAKKSTESSEFGHPRVPQNWQTTLQRIQNATNNKNSKPFGSAGPENRVATIQNSTNNKNSNDLAVQDLKTTLPRFKIKSTTKTRTIR